VNNQWDFNGQHDNEISMGKKKMGEWKEIRIYPLTHFVLGW
jgi:hypothetical protein